MTLLLLVFGLAAAVLPAQAQPGDIRLERLTVDDGLSSSLLTDVVQDERGFLWIGTLHGLNRYDGREIVQFMAGSGEGQLHADGIHCLLAPGDGRLLAGTDKGLAVLDLNGHVQGVVHPDPRRSNDPYEDQVHYLVRDAMGQYWASTPTTIFRLDTNLVVREAFRTQDDPIKGRNRNVHRMIPMPSGEILFRIRDGWHYWSPRSHGLEHLEDGAGSRYGHLPLASYYSSILLGNRYLTSLSGQQLSVVDLAENRTYDLPFPERSPSQRICGAWGNEFAIDVEQGVAIYSLETNGRAPSLKQRFSGLLPGMVINKVTQDREGNYWVAMNGGLAKMPGGAQLFHNQALSGSPQANEGTLDVMDILAQGRYVFIGTSGEGFFQVDTATGEQQRILVEPAFGARNIVWNFRATAGADTLWLGTQRGVVYCTLGHHRIGSLPAGHPGLLDSLPITVQYEDSRRDVWYGLGRGRGAARYDRAAGTYQLYPYGPDGYPYLYPMHAGEDAQGNLWFTSDATGNLVEWDRRTDRFKVVNVPGVDPAINVQSGGFLLDKERNVIWYAILPAGLVRYRIGDGRSTVYTERNGLPSDRINAIAMDGEARLWLGTDQGISCFDPGTGSAINYTRADGLAATSYTAMHYDPAANRISAGAPGVLTWFNVPMQLSDERDMPLFLTGIAVNGHEVEPSGSPLSLGPDEGHIAVKFAAVNLSGGRGNRYQYRLNGGEWTDLGRSPEVRFASIKAGSYRLEARAARKLGPYGRPYPLLTFTVRPRFTSTPWFYALLMGIVLFLVWGWYWYRLRGIRKVEAVRAQISRDLHDEIGSRLTNINMMSQIIRQKAPDGESGPDLLGKIQEESEEITQNMREIIWNIDPQNDQLASAMPRMLSYASQLLEPRNIEVRASIGDLEGIQIDMAKRRDLLPIFKEAVHNIAKHAGATIVQIMAEVKGGNFRLRISDNGRGLDPARVTDGNGLRYMQSRAAAQGWDLQIDSAPGQGTRLDLVVPLK